MCYDVSFTTNIEEISDYFPHLVWDDQISLNLEASYHIIGHAYGQHPVIYRSREDMQLHIRLMEWGCIPFYVKDEKTFIRQRATMLNARSERILTFQFSYWYKIRNRRCLIPVTGTYEHREVKGFKNKIPYYIRLKNQPMFFLPGLYSVAELPDADGVLQQRFTYTIITRNANDVMKNIHNGGDNRGRMPLFLPFELSKSWLDEDVTPDEYRDILNFEMPSEELEYWPVFSIRTSKPHPTGGKKNDPYEWAKLPPLGVGNPD